MNVFHLRHSGDGADFNIFISISILSLYDFRMGFKYDYLIYIEFYIEIYNFFLIVMLNLF